MYASLCVLGIRPQSCPNHKQHHCLVTACLQALWRCVPINFEGRCAYGGSSSTRHGSNIIPLRKSRKSKKPPPAMSGSASQIRLLGIHLLEGAKKCRQADKNESLLIRGHIVKQFNQSNEKTQNTFIRIAIRGILPASC